MKRISFALIILFVWSFQSVSMQYDSCEQDQEYNDLGKALILACFRKNFPEVKALVEDGGADVNFKNSVGNSPLNTIVCFHDEWCKRELLRKPKKIDQHWSIDRYEPYSIDECTIITYLLTNGAHLHHISPIDMFESYTERMEYLHLDLQSCLQYEKVYLQDLTSNSLTIADKMQELYKYYPDLRLLIENISTDMSIDGNR